MTHDPLCPSVVKFYLAASDCTFCELITKVRAACSVEMQAAIDLYILETGPLEFTGDGRNLGVKQNIRLRIKEADELRAEGYAAIDALREETL